MTITADPTNCTWETTSQGRHVTASSARRFGEVQAMVFLDPNLSDRYTWWIVQVDSDGKQIQGCFCWGPGVDRFDTLELAKAAAEEKLAEIAAIGVSDDEPCSKS